MKMAARDKVQPRLREDKLTVQDPSIKAPRWYRRIVTLCYLVAIALATLGWSAAILWGAFAIAKWLIAQSD